HKATDLDFVGAAAGLYKAIMSRGCSARIVLSKRDSLAKGLINQLEKEGYSEAFIEPEESLFLVTPKTLLIVADTHRKGFVEYPELYKVAKTIAVIDHHRKMVDFIDNAVLFYHEPYASSASEMVTELVQYIADKSITVTEATALLAGITLDTRNFSVRTGVRTFEAAAYLRRKGADTAKVKELFSGSMEDYVTRARLVASANIYKGCAIVLGKSEVHKNLRLIAPQAADELLQIAGVKASFVLYAVDGGIYISARSMGKVNVQLVMEKLGGGGHMTMAGAQLKNTDLEGAEEKLIDAIDKYFEENKTHSNND
ncbi:MAG: DHH family phosphoesterase, partial [[Clostridium] cellulosi]